MAPVEPDAFNSNVLPLVGLSAPPLVVVGLLASIIPFLRRASRTLPPSQDTRGKQSRRKQDITIFACLAALSLLITTYHGLNWRVLSYRAWAHDRDVVIPNTIWGDWNGWKEGPGLQLGRWSQDIDLVKEADENAVLSSKGFWWTQQQFLGLVTWSTFTGIQARRRNIPRRILVCFILLGQLTGLSAAVNLFAIALVLTPVPLLRTRDSNPLWTPHPALYIIPALLSFLVVDLLPYVVDKSLPLKMLRAGYFILPQCLAFLPEITPRRWGRSHQDTYAAHHSYTPVFATIAIASFLLHAKQTWFALLDNTPDKYHWHYVFVWNMHQSESLSAVDRAHTSIWRLLNAINEHPAVSVTAWDVLMCSVTLCLWSFARSLDVNDMLKSSCIFIRGSESESQLIHARHVSFSEKDLTNHENSLESHSLPAPSPTKRGRGRPRKSEAPSTSTTGQPLRRSTRRRVAQHESDSEDIYKPSPSIAAEIVATEHEGESGDVATETEATALAWGLFALGGLGLMSSGVFGAEVRSR